MLSRGSRARPLGHCSKQVLQGHSPPCLQTACGSVLLRGMSNRHGPYCPKDAKIHSLVFKRESLPGSDRSKSSQDTHIAPPLPRTGVSQPRRLFSSEAASDFPGLKESFSDIVIIQLRPVDCFSNTSAFDLAIFLHNILYGEKQRQFVSRKGT